MKHLFRGKKYEFPEAHYQTRYNYFKSKIEARTLTGKEISSLTGFRSDPIDRIAFMDAITSLNGTRPLNLVEKLKDPKIGRAIMYEMWGVNFKRGVIPRMFGAKPGPTVSNFNKAFYRLFEFNYPEVRRFSGLDKEARIRAVIDRWVEAEIGMRSAEDAFINLGLNPTVKRRSQIPGFHLKRPLGLATPGVDLTWRAALVEAFSMDPKNLIWFGTPKGRKFYPNEALFERAMKEGLDVMKPEFYKHYRTAAEAELVYERFRRNFARVFKAYGTYYLVKNWNLMVGLPVMAVNGTIGLAKSAYEELVYSDEELNIIKLTRGDLNQIHVEQLSGALWPMLEDAASGVGQASPQMIWDQAADILHQDFSVFFEEELSKLTKEERDTYERLKNRTGELSVKDLREKVESAMRRLIEDGVTTQEKLDEFNAWIKKNHPYDYETVPSPYPVAKAEPGAN